MTIDEFKQKISKLPIEQQAQIIKRVFDLIYEGFDEKVVRLVATSIKFGKENKMEGFDDLDISEKELDKLTNIQDKNRLVQAHLKKK